MDRLRRGGRRAVLRGGRRRVVRPSRGWLRGHVAGDAARDGRAGGADRGRRGGASLAAGLLRRRGVRGPRARERPAHGAPLGRGGCPAGGGPRWRVRGGRSATRPGRRLAPPRRRARRRATCGGDQFVFACGPWLPALFPEVAGDLIAVTKQDVVFVGPRAGDTRFGAASLPCWIDYDASYYGVPGGRRAGLQDRAGPLRRAVRSVVGRPARRPRLDPPRPQLPGAPLPGPRRRADPRDPHLPVRDDAGHELRDRPPSRRSTTCGWSAADRAMASSMGRSSAATSTGCWTVTWPRARRRASGSTGRGTWPPPARAPGA